MTAEQYRRAGELFDEALTLPREQQKAYLDGACADDSALYQYVTTLLAAEADAPKSFLGEPALQVAAKLWAERVLDGTAAPGTQVGSYVIGQQVGMGGMGTVYEAHDLRLDRKVAVKILPNAFVGNADRVQRFRQEARAASLLNHPNIVSIFDAELEHGRYYIATEFVEGRTLREAAAQGPLELKALIDIAVQVCSALDAAHHAGIIHRDIKPENVMLRPDGFVKVLDFGLAKLTERGAAKPNMETAMGHIAGTIHYLSPEQLLGKPAGPQSDIFSLGVMLYELSSGMRPFSGATEAVTWSAILNDVPPLLSSVAPRIGTELDAVVARAIEKDPEMRFQTAADLRAALRFVSKELTSGAGVGITKEAQQQERVPARQPRKQILMAFAWLLAGMLLAAGITRLWLSSRPVGPLPDRFMQLTESTGEEIFANLSPDNKEFIYASAARGKWDIYLQRVGGSTSENLTADSANDDREPALSRDGSHIAFRSEREGGGLYVMEATGENPIRITDSGYLPSWSPDGKSIVYSDIDFTFPSNRSGSSHLVVVNLATGARQIITTKERKSGNSLDAIQPNWSPHGYRIAYWGLSPNGERDIGTIPAAGGQAETVTLDAPLDWNPVWSPNGDYLYFISDRGGPMNLWRVAIDEQSGRVKGKPEAVTTPANYMMFLNFSADGSQFLYSQTTYRVNLFSIAFDRKKLITVGEPAQVGDASHNVTMFDFSPDGASIVYDTIGAPHEDLWIETAAGAGRRRLLEGGKNHGPAWSPAGDEIAFFSNRGGFYQEWMIHPDGSGLRPLTALPPSGGAFGMQAPTWMADGKQIIAGQAPGGPTLLDPKLTTPAVRTVPLPGFDSRALSIILWPPVDGVAVGYFLDGSERMFLYAMKEGKMSPMEPKGSKPVMIPGLGNRKILYFRGSTCYLYDVDLKREKRLFSTPPNHIYCVRPSPDGKRIFFSVTIREADVWMAEMKR